MRTATSVLSRSHSSAPSPRHQPDPEAKLTELGASLQRIDAEHEQKRAQLEAEVARAKEIQRQLANLNRAVDDAADNIVRADEQNASFQSGLATMREGILSSWAKHHFDGSAGPLPDYSGITIYKEAVADFPRVREHLVAKLKDAETALSSFQRDNNL